MASDDIKMVVSAEDRASATLRQIQASLGQLGKSVESFQDRAGRIFNAGVFGISAASTALFLKSSVEEYAKAEQAQIKLQSVLRATGNTTKLSQQQIEDFAQSIQNATGTEAEEVLDAASQLGRMSGIAGEQFKEILSLANDMKTVLGGDMTSAAMQLAKALNSPAEGMAKLARSGIMFTEFQKETIKYLDETGKKAEAQAAILQEIRRQFGGAGAEFGDSVAGNIRQLEHAIGDLSEAIGEQLAPLVKDLTNFINKQTGKDAIASSREALRTAGVTPMDNKLAEEQALGQQIMSLQGQISRLAKQRDEEARGFFGLSPRASFDYAIQIDALRQRQLELQAQKDAIQAQADAQRQTQNLFSGLRNAAGDVGGQLFGGFSHMFTRLNTGSNVAGVQLPSTTEIGLQLLLNGALGQWSPFAMQQQQQEKREQERRDNLPALAATEARFLQRGRGLLDPAAAAANKQVALLERIDSTLRRIENGDVILAAEAIG